MHGQLEIDSTHLLSRSKKVQQQRIFYSYVLKSQQPNRNLKKIKTKTQMKKEGYLFFRQLR